MPKQWKLTYACSMKQDTDQCTQCTPCCCFLNASRDMSNWQPTLIMPSRQEPIHAAADPVASSSEAWLYQISACSRASRDLTRSTPPRCCHTRLTRGHACAALSGQAHQLITSVVLRVFTQFHLTAEDPRAQHTLGAAGLPTARQPLSSSWETRLYRSCWDAASTLSRAASAFALKAALRLPAAACRAAATACKTQVGHTYVPDGLLHCLADKEGSECSGS